VLIVLPNLCWVISHRDLAFGLVYKFGIHATTPWAQAVGKGLRNWFVAMAAHLAPLLVVFGAIFWKPIFMKRGARLHSEEERFLWRTFLIVAGMVMLSVLVMKVTQFK